ncbi:hypothetical protein Tco_1028490 [Tanacetum coccineum]|uniref:Kinetochore protein SPC25 n=1 Tax=Tanacetum coccineum TaxID=301880 RepID=A0ABQ5G0S9_9ASTR
MTIEEATTQLKEIQRLANLNKAKEESKKQLKRKLSQATIKAQEQKWQEHEAKKAKMLDDYMGIFTRSNDLTITKISYTIDARNILTMRITRDHDPLNLTIKIDSEVAKEMMSEMNFVIEARDDCSKARKIIEQNLDNLG